MKRLLRYTLVLILVVLIVIAVRTFCLGSYYISTHSMAPTLQKGDFVLVNKILQGSTNPACGKPVLFSSPLIKDSVAPPLFLSRCVGMPGDTVQISYEGHRINRRLIPNTQLGENAYAIEKQIKTRLLDVLNTQKIPCRTVSEDSLNLVLRLTSSEVSQIRKQLDSIVKIEQIPEMGFKYQFVIPKKGCTYQLDSITRWVYQEAILKELNGKPKIHNGKLYLDGKEILSFTFPQDYYWMISDNSEGSIDSRHLGLIPFYSVVGNTSFCWYSKDKNRIFQWIH